MGGAVFPSCHLFGANYGGGNEDNGNLLQKIPCMYCHTQYLQPCSRPPPTHTSAGDSWTLTGKSGSVCGVTAPFSWVLGHTRFCLCPPRVYFPVLCKFWRLCGGVNGDHLQGGSCHTQVCCTQSPWPCGRPLLTQTSTGGAQTQFCLSLCWVPRFWCAQGLFEPSERLWWEWGLILNANLPLLSSCWGFSFAFGQGMGYLLTAAPAPTILLDFLWPWAWGISSRLLQRHAAALSEHRQVSNAPWSTPSTVIPPSVTSSSCQALKSLFLELGILQATEKPWCGVGLLPWYCWQPHFSHGGWESPDSPM